MGSAIGAELLGASVYEIDPSDRLCPYHAHHANEEWLLVLSGEPTLRTPDGEETLEEGDVVCFLRNREGAHLVSNRTDSPVRVLMLSTLIEREIVEYLDTGKVLLNAKGEKLMRVRPGPEVDYWEGEA